MQDTDDDGQLFEAWGRGERRAGEALIERHYDAIERFFSCKAGDRADDLVQQTFLRCSEAAPRFRGEGSFRAFLFGIARNVLCEHIRGRMRDQKSSPDFATSAIIDLLPGVATQVSASAERRQLVLALQRIPLDLQILLELFYWEDLSIDELAQCMQVPAGTIKSRLHRARGLLKAAMEALPGSDEDRAGGRTLLVQWLAQVRERAPSV